jgi:hypothetical protein
MGSHFTNVSGGAQGERLFHRLFIGINMSSIVITQWNKSPLGVVRSCAGRRRSSGEASGGSGT